MRRQCGQSGMSLMEVLVALAVILVLISAMTGVGTYVKTRASVDLTRSMLEVLCTSLSQYYDDLGDFPFAADTAFSETDFESLFLPVVADVLPVDSLNETDGSSPPITVLTASSAALFYFLDRNPPSRNIAGAVDNSLITNKDAGGNPIMVTISGTPYDLPRYIDPWKMSIRYEYLAGTAFPVLTSAGPDKIFDTPDDITSK